MPINIQKALGVASKFLGNDKIQQAINLSKSVKSPQDAYKALSQLGDPNAIINNGLDKLNSPTAKKMASMFGANDAQLEELKNQILGIKNQSIVQQKEPQTNTNITKNSTSARLARLMKGLK